MADSTNFVINYLAQITDVRRKLSELDRINARIAQQFGAQFSRATQVISRSIDSVSQKTINIKGLGNVNAQFGTLRTTVRTADGQIKVLSESVRSVRGQAFQPLNDTLKVSSKQTRTFGQDIGTLIRRAALTIPVWFALRNSIQGVFRTIRDGLGDIAEFDRSLQKLRRNLEATSTNVEADFRKVQDEIQRFSVETGRSVEEITNAIQRFATVGFNFEESLIGGIQATKLAVTLFGDAEDTANAFARSLRVLTENIDSSEERQRAIQEALALTDRLWQTNAFEVDEFSNNLEKFAGTAAVANLSINETIQLLATLSTGGLGNRAGRLLRSTLLRALSDIENVTNELELDFDPNRQPTIQFILALVERLRELRTEGNVPAELAETLGDLFSVRSTEALAALTALEDTLTANIALQPDLAKFNETFDRVNDTTFQLVERFKNLNKEIGRSFTTGLVGGEDYGDTLRRIVSIQEDLNNNAERFGILAREAFVVAGVTSVVAFRKQLLGLIPILTTRLNPAIASIALAFTVLDFKSQVEQFERQSRAVVDVANQIGQEIGQNIIRGINRQLSTDELEKLITQIETFGPQQLNIDAQGFENTLDALRKILEVQQQVSEVVQKRTEREQNSREVSKLIIEDTLERLRAEGALESTILKTERALLKQFNIKEDTLQIIQRELELQRAVNEEQRLQSRLSSDSVKLFRIAQEEGTGIARAIGEVLAGQRDFNTFVRRGGRELEVFKEQFADIFEQQQATAFFSGSTVPGLRGLRGGQNIPIEEKVLQEPANTIADSVINLNKALNKFFPRVPDTIQELRAGTLTVQSFTPGFGAGQNLATNLQETLPLSTIERQRAISFGGGRAGQQVALTIDVTGNRQVLVGTQEQIAEAMAEAGKGQIKQFFIDSLKNIEDPLTQQINTNIENF